ncbi:MAG: hypothetical protein NC420_10865 [Eubacterium sp.]|nr:hypothetical protein [Eubacterium sp.]MCM1213102.1 hypothetical protein [Lachnospiraceae bacterium]MCM1239408.1 hypothetical protein [Lachnospiraceae bacterium]
MPTHCLSSRDLLHCGSQYGFQQNGGGLSVESDKAVFVSQIYDSGREGTEWDHLLLDIDREAVLELYVWLFDRIDERGERLLRQDPASWFRENEKRAQYHSDYRNMLLYGNGCGRYARLAVKILQSGEKEQLFRGYDLSFPKESFTKYLPAIYQGNSRLERFLAVHQNLYLGLEKSIDDLAEKLDLELCLKNQAVRLARWIGWGELAKQVDEDILRELLRKGVSLASKKGTCGYYIEMTKILTGKDAFLIEEPEEGRAVVLIREQPKKGRERYLEWLRKNVPIGIEIDFVILHRTDRLGSEYFLDVTSGLSEYESALTVKGCPVESLKLL